MLLTNIEVQVLKDVCRRVNGRLRDPALYQSLFGRGLIARSLSGAWMCTSAGREVIVNLYGL